MRDGAGQRTQAVLHVENTGQQLLLRPGASILIGRLREADIAFPDDKGCSREQVRITAGASGWRLHALSTAVPTEVNGRTVDQLVTLAHGDVITFSDKRIAFVEMPVQADTAADETRSGAPQRVTDDGEATVIGGPPQGRRQAMPSLPERIDLEARRTIIGRGGEGVQLRLDHPAVSRRHAELRLKEDRAELRDLGSSNGTFLNGERVSGRVVLNPGDVIDIGPYTLSFDGRHLLPSTRVGNIRICATALTRDVPIGPQRTMTRILNDVSLVIEPREFVCLLGPSGSGKSTLMNALSARQPATYGQVTLNGQDLYANFDLLKEDMALVPQFDLMHEDLTLREALFYTARLRLPADKTRESITADIERVVESVELGHRVDARIANYSGGQKKRASLANETVSGPSLLFLDEVTSGLDEATDWEMMRLFRQMAERGMTVICVTHTLVNIEEFAHKVVIMTNPGMLAFYGTPAEALQYFGVRKLGDIYRKLGEQPGETWKAAYEASPFYQRYVSQPLDRHSGGAPQKREAARPVRERLRAGLIDALRQFGILTHRYTRLLFADRRTLGIAGIQSVIIGLLLALVFGEVDPDDPKEKSILFLLAICAFWFGCNNASKEIVKERQIFLQERAINLSVFGYVLSKMVVFSALAAVQVLILGIIFNLFSVIPGVAVQQLSFMVMTALAGTALGLIISAATSTRDQANTLVPLALIPQIALAGVIVPDMPELADRMAELFITAFWAFEGMAGTIAPDRSELLYPEPTDPGLANLMLAVHTLVFFAIAYGTLVLRSRR